jgi:6-pyruvoyl-tetrahydropterin synthase
MTYTYNIKYLFERKHYNPPFTNDYHSHEFIVNFELSGNINSHFNNSEYGIDTVEFQKYLGRFVETLPDKLNTDSRLSKKSCSTESLCNFFVEYFPNFLKESGYKKLKSVVCLSVSVFEGYSRETKLNVNNNIFE